MAHLVQDRVGAPCALGSRGFATVDVRVLGERHTAGVFHCAEVVFGNEDGIVLAPHIRVVEHLRQKLEALLGHG